MNTFEKQKKMTKKKYIWRVKLDWLSILEKLGLSSIDQIPEYKRERAIKNVAKMFDSEELLDASPTELDDLVVNELRDLMKKELKEKQRKENEMREKFKKNIVPLKQGGIIRINPKDLKDLDTDGNPEDILKYLYKKIFGNDRRDHRDDDEDNIDEDRTGYYI